MIVRSPQPDVEIPETPLTPFVLRHADRLAGILQTVLSCKAEDAAARPDKAEATRAQAAKAELLRPAIVPFRNVLLVKASQHDHDRIAQLLGDIWDKLQSGP